MPSVRKIVDGQELDPRTTPEYYSKSAIKSGEWTDAEIRREYSRLRDIAQKRLERLGRNEPGSFAYRHNVGQYPTLKETGTEGARALLPRLARFIGAKTGSVTGIREQRAKALESLREHGYTFLNKSNIKQFGQFMEQFRASKGSKVIGSPTAVELFEQAKEKHMNIDQIKMQFEMWLQALPDLQQIPPLPDRMKKNPKTGKMERVKASADDYQRAVNKLRKERGQSPLKKSPKPKEQKNPKKKRG